MKTVLAFDFGASSGRAIKATYNNGTINYSEIHRFDNIPIESEWHLYHNVPMIMDEINKAIDKAGQVDSLAFDTWGVDYGLLDNNGDLINLPYHYRDKRTKGKVNLVSDRIDLDTLYRKTGNQIMEINTLFQLLSDENLKKAKTLLFMPDLFSYLLCKNKVCEKTIASTSQMLNPITGLFDDEVLHCFDIDKSLFPTIINSGTIIGDYRGIKVISVAGHDTQCATVSIPSEKGDVAFLSCGTWSLIGCEVDKPILNENSNTMALSNEIGANGKINYLKNISGLWLIQETKRYYNEIGKKYSYNDLEMLAKDSQPFKCFIDPDCDMLSERGKLIDKIKLYCQKTNQEIPQNVGEVVRCIYESLALKYRYALEQISKCTGKNFSTLHILGGGTKDAFLCSMTADSIDIPVIAGPIEATAMGNIILQLIALGEIKDISQGRKMIMKTETLKTYTPQHTTEWDKAYEKYVEIIK